MTTSDSTQASLGARVAALLLALQHWPWLDTFHTLRQRFREDRLGLTASSLTFTTTIALVPMLTVTLAVFTAFPVFARFQKALQDYFIQTLVPDSIAKPVLTALTQFALKANRLGTLGLVVLVLTALALMLTIDRTLNAIWRVRKPRPIAQRVLVYWAAATLGPLVLGVSLTLTSYALSASKGLVGALPGGLNLLFAVLEFMLLAAGMASLYRYVPNTHVRWSHAWAGGVFVAVGFDLARRGLAWYLGTVPTYTTIYGAFATVPIFLVWLYLGWVVVLLGAVIAAYAPSLQMHISRRAATPGHRFELGLRVLRELAVARDGAEQGWSLEQISSRLKTDPLQIEPILDAVVDLHWVGRLDEPGAARYVLLCNPAMTPLQPLVQALLLEHTPLVHRFWQRAGFTSLSLKDALDG